MTHQEVEKIGSLIYNDAALATMVDTLDGEKGDTTGFESTILTGVLGLKNDPKKFQETVERLNQLSKCNTELQSAYDKKNLLSGMGSGDINKADILETIKKLERKKLRIMRFAQVKEGKLGTTGERDVIDRKQILDRADSFEKVRASDVLFLSKRFRNCPFLGRGGVL